MNRHGRPSHLGVVTSVRGSVVDARFNGHLPPIYSVLRAGDEGRIVIEVLAQRDARHVRGIALTPTQGLARGMNVEDTSEPLQAPVGKGVLSRMFDVFGNAIDRGPPLADVKWRSVYRAPPPLAQRSTKSEIFATGIKVIDVLTRGPCSTSSTLLPWHLSPRKRTSACEESSRRSRERALFIVSMSLLAGAPTARALRATLGQQRPRFPCAWPMARIVRERPSSRRSTARVSLWCARRPVRTARSAASARSWCARRRPAPINEPSRSGSKQSAGGSGWVSIVARPACELETPLLLRHAGQQPPKCVFP
jgi:hypothetical protein